MVIREYLPFRYKLALHNTSTVYSISCILYLMNKENENTSEPSPFVISGCSLIRCHLPQSSSKEYSFIITPTHAGYATLPRLLCIVESQKHRSTSPSPSSSSQTRTLSLISKRRNHYAKIFQAQNQYLSVSSLSLYEKFALLSCYPPPSQKEEKSSELSEIRSPSKDPPADLQAPPPSTVAPFSSYSLFPLPPPTKTVLGIGHVNEEELSQRILDGKVDKNTSLPGQLSVPQQDLENSVDYIGLANDFSFNLPFQSTSTAPDVVWIPQVSFSESLITSCSSFINPPDLPTPSIRVSPLPEASKYSLILQMLEDLPPHCVPIVIMSPIYNVHKLPKVN
jgi:hypothetical protein